MQIDLSPLTVFKTGTNYTPLTNGEKIFISWTKNKINARGQFATRGLNSRSLTVWTLMNSNLKTVDKKRLTTRLNNYGVGFR